MFGLEFFFEDNTKAVTKAADEAIFRNLGHAAASIRKDVQGTIKNAPESKRAKRRKGRVVRRATHAASPPGTPPYTQRGQLRRAIVYDVDKTKQNAVVGPRRSIVGESGQAHEFGGKYKGQDYPERPFMFPGLERGSPRFGESFRGSIGQ